MLTYQQFNVNELNTKYHILAVIVNLLIIKGL
jgi:hypothetical protein